MKSVLALAVMALALNAENSLPPISGNCRISAAEKAGEVQFEINHGTCSNGNDCHESNMTKPVSEFSGFSLEDLAHNGAHLNAEFHAEAGKIRCSGEVRDSVLYGEFSFHPDPAFVEHMRQLGFTGLTSRNLEVYAIFQVETSWLKSLQTAGVQGITTDNIVALRIFHVDAEYVQSLADLGYPTASAQELIAMRVHGVSPAEIKEIQALGLHPTAEELVQMRIFKITPDFVRRMQSHGLKNLTISQLVKIRIFKLDE
jgi:hypothetical protein